MREKKTSNPDIILYVIKEEDKTNVWRVSPKGALKLIRKGIKGSKKEMV